MENCPCQSGRPYEECCKPHHLGNARPETAEALMRSRYSAFVKGDIVYLKKSCGERALKEFDEKSTRQWAENSKWLGLEIVSTEGGLGGDNEGKVEFIAKYETGGKDVSHHEIAEFRRDAKTEAWVFIDGKAPKAQPVLREEPKTGRNDPCPCGSGKKYKKCCGN